MWDGGRQKGGWGRETHKEFCPLQQPPPSLQQCKPIGLFLEAANKFPKSPGTSLRHTWVEKQIRDVKVIDETVMSQENSQEVGSRRTWPQVTD